MDLVSMLQSPSLLLDAGISQSSGCSFQMDGVQFCICKCAYIFKQVCILVFIHVCILVR
jgi:hypothetical protein